MGLIDLSCCAFSTEVAFMFQTSVENFPYNILIWSQCRGVASFFKSVCVCVFLTLLGSLWNSL